MSASKHNGPQPADAVLPYYKKCAEFLLRDLQSDDGTRVRGALLRLRRARPHFRSMPDANVITAARTSDAQDAIAKEAGEDSWRSLAANLGEDPGTDCGCSSSAVCMAHFTDSLDADAPAVQRHASVAEITEDANNIKLVMKLRDWRIANDMDDVPAEDGSAHQLLIMISKWEGQTWVRLERCTDAKTGEQQYGRGLDALIEVNEGRAFLHLGAAGTEDHLVHIAPDGDSRLLITPDGSRDRFTRAPASRFTDNEPGAIAIEPYHAPRLPGTAE